MNKGAVKNADDKQGWKEEEGVFTSSSSLGFCKVGVRSPRLYVKQQGRIVREDLRLSDWNVINSFQGSHGSIPSSKISTFCIVWRITSRWIQSNTEIKILENLHWENALSKFIL